MSTNQNHRLKVGYIVKMFPRLSETFILNEILELERNGAEVVIFSLKKPNEGKFHPQLSDLKARVFYLEDLDTKKWVNWVSDIWGNLEPVKENFISLFERSLKAGNMSFMEYTLWSAWVAATAMELGISHFHAHFASLPSTIAYYAGRIASIPFSFTAHAKDIYVYDMEEHLLREKLFASDFTVTVTKYNSRYLLENNPDLDPDKIKVIYNGVRVDSLKPSGESKRQKNTILAVGRLVPKKGFDTLLDACLILKNGGADFKCRIAGDGHEAENLHLKRKMLGLENDVEFLGPRTQDEIIDLMYESSIMCLPCRVAEDGNMDALPTVLLESLACGLPAISTNISGIPEIIDSGLNGLLVGPDNPAELSNGIARLLDSPEYREKITKAGFSKAADCFDISKNVSTLKALFERNAGRGKVDKKPARSSDE